MRKIALAGLIVLALSRPAAAQQLTITTRIEARKAEMPPPSNPIVRQFYEGISADLMKLFIGPYVAKPVEFTYVISDRGLRAEGTQEGGFLRPGAVGIFRPDRSRFLLRPDVQVYAELSPAPPAPQLRTDRNALSFTRTGETATVAGVVAERVTFENVFDNPATDLLSKRAGEPIVVSVSGDAWISTHHKKYADLLLEHYTGAPFAFPLLNALQREGLILRFVLRSQFFNGYELDRTTIQITERPLERELFEVPKGFKEIGAAGKP